MWYVHLDRHVDAYAAAAKEHLNHTHDMYGMYGFQQTHEAFKQFMYDNFATVI